VTQENVLMTTLTVAETVRYSAQLQLPDSMSPSEKRSRADDAIKQMGLAAVAQTRIGGRARKGISGGQKKRVSICIELLASPALIFLDEPTSGLDSAASYHVMSRIAGIAQRGGTTVVAAMHQPSSEVFELFHDLCLLTKVLFTSQVFLGLGGEILSPRPNLETSRMSRVLLRYFWGNSRPIPKLPDPLALILGYSRPRGYLVFLVVEDAATTRADGGGDTSRRRR
jgi:ABC-type nitrate/sulfonate/bicarbonate transport system ATPase subunit